MDPALQEIIREDLNPHDEIEAIIRLRDPGKVPPNVKVVTQLGNVVTCRVRRGHVRKVYMSEQIESFKASRYIAVEPDAGDWISRPFISNGEATGVHAHVAKMPTGKGTVIGIVDWGMDFAHPNFRQRDGTTRLRAIWDQSVTGAKPVQPYGYGTLHTAQDINRALEDTYPYRALGYHPAKGDPRGTGAHGTVVADIAAGNGALGMEGVAPEAEIVFVHLSSREVGPLANLGDSVRILEAIDFISHRAGNAPCVINLSVGRHGGHHMGTSLVEQGMDAFLAAGPNRAICQSTGNYYRALAHSSGVLRPGTSSAFTFHIDPADITGNELEVWYQGCDEVIFELSNEGYRTSFRCDAGRRTDMAIGGNTIGRIYHRVAEPNTGLNNINTFLYKNAPVGRWKGRLYARKVLDGRYHAYVERDGGCRYCQSRFSIRDADSAYTTGTICNGFNTIAVGAYDAFAPAFRMAPFSSKGPTADGRLKPDLVAPGVRVPAARSTPGHMQRSTRLLTQMSGTSMAAPHVTGAVALMFEKIVKPVRIHDIRNILLGSTDSVQVSPGEQLRVGSGRINLNRILYNVGRYNQIQRSRVMSKSKSAVKY